MNLQLDQLTSAFAGRYRVERELGAGGMATVYLAADLKHDRKVAIKVLKPELAAVLGAERFVQEIKTTAALQHPHILPLFDSGTASSHPERREGSAFLYYVMPYIQGETIREKLDRETQFGIDEAVRIAREVADALDYAHRHGVIHRDIKPENILLHDGRAMVMDFGIALALSAAAGGRMTETGLSLGTPHYMSPEQATAEKEITGRSDIYSLASVLYEMLAGQPPHLGGSAQQIIMKIITEPAPVVTQFRKSVPPNVAAAVAKALEKLPADRFENAKAFSDALANASFTTATSRGAPSSAADSSRIWKRATIAMGVVAGVFGVLLAFSATRDRVSAPAASREPIRFALVDDPGVHVDPSFTHPFDVSPDGRTIVFRASTDSTPPQLWVRTLDSPGARPVPGTVNGGNASFSPDGQWIAFLTENRILKKVQADGSGLATIATTGGVSAALAWASDTSILFEELSGVEGIHRVNANGGRAEPAVPLDTAAHELRQRRPLMLRAAGTVVYASNDSSEDEPTLVMYRFADGRRARLGLPGIGGLAVIEGRLVYSRRDGTLMAVEIDANAMRVRGEPVRLSARASAGATGSRVALSESGVLVYTPAGAGALARLELVDSSRKARPLHGAASFVGTPRFSPDGKRLVVGIGNDGGIGPSLFGVHTSDLWSIDLRTGEKTRVTSNSDAAEPSWFPDGLRVAYLKAVGAGFEVWSQRVDGGAPPSSLARADGAPYAIDVAPDGRSILVRTAGRGFGALSRISLDAPQRTDTIVRAQVGVVRPEHPRISPDGRWVSYIDRSTFEVWVHSLRDSSTLMVSTMSSLDSPAVWGPDSRTLYYRSPEGVSVIELQTTPVLSVARRRSIRGMPVSSALDLARDGKTFVMATPAQAAGVAVVAVDWLNEARREWSGKPKK